MYLITTLTLLTGHQVLDPIPRDDIKPDVRSIHGIKTTYFCFMSIGRGRIACRYRSCFCDVCLEVGRKSYLLGRRCDGYETCGSWKHVRMYVDDEEWDSLIQLLRDEGGKGNGYNRTGKWNDYCGCYHQREENGVMVMTDELEFGCDEGISHIIKNL